jgi:pteridine reductase
VIHYRESSEAALALCERLNQLRPNSAITLQGDLQTIDQLPQWIERVVNTWGRLDVLVNNASGFYHTPVGQVTEAMWDDLQSSNVKGAFFLSQAAFPHLKSHAGAIINIADTHAERPLRDYSVYCIAKAALVMATKALAKEFAPYVRVNAVSPGNVAWPEQSNALTAQQQHDIIDKIPLHRQGCPEDIAQAVYYLSQANYVTGQILAVDGGRGLK